jgi:hypothetical protein
VAPIFVNSGGSGKKNKASTGLQSFENFMVPIRDKKKYTKKVKCGFVYTLWNRRF